MGEVKLENVTVRFGSNPATQVTALEGLHLTIPEQQFAVIVGPSGCGKSSCLDLVAGLNQATSGRTSINGTTIEKPGRSGAWSRKAILCFPG